MTIFLALTTHQFSRFSGIIWWRFYPETETHLKNITPLSFLKRALHPSFSRRSILIYTSIHLSIYLSIYPFIYLFMFHYLCSYLSFYTSVSIISLSWLSCKDNYLSSLIFKFISYLVFKNGRRGRIEQSSTWHWPVSCTGRWQEETSRCRGKDPRRQISGARQRSSIPLSPRRSAHFMEKNSSITVCSTHEEAALLGPGIQREFSLEN